MLVWLENITSQLSIADRKCTDTFLFGDGTATRCGRFDSWAIKRKNEFRPSFFAKYCRSQAHFQREIFGFRAMQGLAARTSEIMAADIIATDPTHNLVVTNSLGDCSLHQMLRSGFRIDKCLLRSRSRRQAVDRVVQCIETVIALIDALKNVESESSSGDLLDHGVGAVVERINRKLQKIHVQPACGGASYSSELPLAIELNRPVRECSRVLVHGDLSAGNILIDGEAVGLVDFEDMGMGPTFRDTLWIRYLFELGNRPFYYRSFNNLSDMLLATESRSEYKIIYQLDFSFLNLLYMQQKHGSLSFWRNALTAREVRWACSQISKLYQRACKDGLLRPRSPTSETSSQSGRSAVPLENATGDGR